MIDVCLFLEGTYPYTQGGVASWTDQLIRSLPHMSFHLVFIGSLSKDLPQVKFSLPPNVVGLDHLFLFDSLEPSYLPCRLSKQELRLFHSYFQKFNKKDLKNLRNLLMEKNCDSFEFGKAKEFWKSPEAWQLMEEDYLSHDPTQRKLPFLDFYYTWNSALKPLYRCLSCKVPEARVYHSLCTGYAGFLGAVASIRNDAPLVLTEHGIYAHERAIELGEASWLFQSSPYFELPQDPTGVFRDWWIQMFRSMSLIAYEQSNQIITLYEGNRRRQLQDGAEYSKTKVLSNGVPSQLKGLRREMPSWNNVVRDRPFQIVFAGRMVSIKDIKNLIRAMRIVVDQGYNVQCDLFGPREEDSQYFEQCLDLISFLELSGHIRYRGVQSMGDVLAGADLLVLCSISEAQPLVVLEANLAGVPVVCTDVGACRELLEGNSEADRRLGLSGLVVPLGDSEKLAEAIATFISQSDFWEKASLAGVERVSAFYDESLVWRSYDNIYRTEFLRGGELWQE